MNANDVAYLTPSEAIQIFQIDVERMISLVEAGLIKHERVPTDPPTVYLLKDDIKKYFPLIARQQSVDAEAGAPPAASKRSSGYKQAFIAGAAVEIFGRALEKSTEWVEESIIDQLDYADATGKQLQEIDFFGEEMTRVLTRNRSFIFKGLDYFIDTILVDYADEVLQRHSSIHRALRRAKLSRSDADQVRSVLQALQRTLHDSRSHIAVSCLIFEAGEKTVLLLMRYRKGGDIIV